MNPFVISFRRIIYSIPLKRLLVGLAVFSVLLASFSSADDLGINVRRTKANGWNVTRDYSSSDYICVFSVNYNNNESPIYGEFTVGNSSRLNTCFWNLNQLYVNLSDECCLKGGQLTLYSTYSNTDFYVLSYNLISSLQCQTEYNLIPVESVDQEYCTTNNLCPTYDCPTNPIGTGSLSNLYINNILHIGAPNIIMNIPEEIDWDYAYTMGGNTMNIDIVGYNQDYEKIEDWIYTNNYKPSSDDFTNIFTNFSNFGGLLIATLFVILVFYFVKKMFK